MSEHDDPFEQVARAAIADQLEAQHHLIALEMAYYERMLETDVGAIRFVLGPGVPSYNGPPGSPRDKFNGVVIFNASAAQVWWSPTAGAAARVSPYVIPPFSWLALPTRFYDWSVAVDSPDVAGQQTLTVLPLRVPPHGALAGSYGGQPIADTLQADAYPSGPVAGQVIASIPIIPGVYTVAVSVASSSNDVRVGVVSGGVQIAELYSNAATGVAKTLLTRATLPGPTLQLVNNLLTTALVAAHVTATQLA